MFDVASGVWNKLEPLGEPPSPRAAHAAAAVGNMVVVQGGIGPAGLATGDLHVLDLSPATPRWHRVVVPGPGPAARYAHVLALLGQRFLIVIGGNDGRNTLDDIWALDTATKPYAWLRVRAQGPLPAARMYAAAAARSDGLLLLSGGRDASSQPLADTYGLARHRDGRWEWAPAPGTAPSARYQHTAAFVDCRLHVVGGALGGGRLVDKDAELATLCTNAGTWAVSGDGGEGDDGGRQGDASVTARCRHAMAVCKGCMFVYGGLRGGVLLDDLLAGTDAKAETNEAGTLGIVGKASSPAWRAWQLARGGELPPEQMDIGVGMNAYGKGEGSPSTPDDPAVNAGVKSGGRPPPRPGSHTSTPGTEVRLHNRAVVVAAAADSGDHFGGLVRQLSIDQFENEARRVSMGTPSAQHSAQLSSPASASGSTPIMQRVRSMGGVHKAVLQHLLKPRGWEPPSDRSFILSAESISDLCDKAEAIFQDEKSVLQVRAPVKIFGDLHGQFVDLMRLFAEYGSPSTAGDINYIDYLFLGDYVDRGNHSLETLCLLLALKIEHPNNVHLIRGNHEASDINALFGFRTECVERLGEEQGIWVWQRFNQVFNWLPLAASIEGKILCMHGGIGRCISKVEQIEAVVRPVTMEGGGQLLMDLLWSDPTDNDGIEGLQPNARGPGLVTFGPDRVRDFCSNNNLSMLVRAHECVMDGFERFAQGHLITVFSATNYCGTANNAGAILVVGRDLLVVPKLIHPLPPTIKPGAESPGDEGGLLDDMWMSRINEERPPTPPRQRGGGNSARVAGAGSLAFF